MNQPTRRTQAERREQTRRQVLDAACELFGERGYGGTSLDDVARACGLTTRPVYHYFGNKQALFAAVHDRLQQRIIATMEETPDSQGIADSWERFLDLCEDPAFRQVVLIDGPTVLGRAHWTNSAAAAQVEGLFSRDATGDRRSRIRAQLLARAIIGAFSEVALAIADMEDVELARSEALKLVTSFAGQTSAENC